MEKKTKGAWLLAQSKSLDAVSGVGRLENIQYAGRTGRLYNLLRRNSDASADDPVIDATTVKRVCQLNGIDRAARESGLARLKLEGRIDLSAAGDVSVLGATTTAVLETTAAIFDAGEPSNEEQAVVHLSEKIAERPTARQEVVEYVSDTFMIPTAQTNDLIGVCKSAAILDESEDKGFSIIFNNNTFRDGQYAKKAYWLMQALNTGDQERLSQLQELLLSRGAVLDFDAQRILGLDLYHRLIGVGLFDRLEVSNSAEAVGYLTSPDAFQKYGRPFEDDPVDDAKALLASLTYGMTRSNAVRGSITMPDVLLRRLISGYEVGGISGVQAIGEDYRELEKRQVVQVNKKSPGRFTMRLLKKDVGELALAIITGSSAATEALLMDGSAASRFSGPAETRQVVRARHTLHDHRFAVAALDRLRSGG